MLNIINVAALCRLWRLREEEDGFHGALTTKLKEALPCKQECQSKGAEHIYLVFVM
jgi:hypothetical protein